MRRICGLVFFVFVAAGCTGGNTVTYQASDAGDGVFVSSNTGSDANDGTKRAPVRTIGRALSLLGGQSNIYVCAGNYAEQVSLDESTAVAGIYGGFDCSTWQYNASNKPVVRSPSPDYALKIANIASTITISDIEFDAQTATNPGGSSMAAFVLNSKDVKFVRSVLVAGSGQIGASGQTGSNYAGGSAPSGNSAQGTTGGATQTACVCNDGVNSTGGAGGTGDGYSSPNPPGMGMPDLGGGVPGTLSYVSCGAGGQGASGVAGTVAVTPTPPAGTVISIFGNLDEVGWHPAMGATGTSGTLGQGGGGGSEGGLKTGSGCDNNGNCWDNYTYYGGGSGGCGGCGGAAGGSAQGGGASVALVSLQSTITLTNSSLTAGQAGNGGSGAAGQPGQRGGAGGAGSGGGCSGGNGGNGGDGGASAGGIGGIAAGVLWLGDVAPMLDDTTNANVVSGRAGQGGSGGNPGVNDGPSGVAGAMLQVTP